MNLPDYNALLDWCPQPHIHLRGLPNGTLFLLRKHTGSVHLCQLYGNMQDDLSWKAQSLTDFRIIRLNRLRGAAFVLISEHKGRRHFERSWKDAVSPRCVKET